MSKGDLNRLGKLTAAHDDAGIAEMQKRGLVWAEPNGTECVLLESRQLASRVRIVSGPNKGKCGWVAADCLST